MISDEEKGAKSRQTRVNPHQSALNKLMQSGRSARATKSCGHYGEGDACSVSGGIVGNMHPGQYVAMEKGLSGSHVVACKERFLVATGRPVQPHQGLPADYVLPAGVDRWTWVPLNRRVASILNLGDGASGPEAASKVWKTIGPVCEQNYDVNLPDGVNSRVRFIRNESEPSGFEAEWRISNRAFAIPAEHDLSTSVRRCVEYFTSAHMTIEFDDDARKLMLSYQGALNVQSFLFRESGDTQSGARMGCAPWQVGELASLLLCFDIFWGRYSSDPKYASKTLAVTRGHVERAADCIDLSG